MLISNDLYRSIGERIKRAREAQYPKVSQDDLAVSLNLKRTSVTNIERGKQKLTLETLYGVCAKFGLRIDELLPPVEDVICSPETAPVVVVGGQTLPAGPKLASSVERHRTKSGASNIG